MGPSGVVITSAPASSRPANTSTVAFDGRRFWQVEVPHLNAFYPGTGDAFASVLTGSLLLGDSLPVAVDRAVHSAYLGIQATYGYDTPHRDGVLLERTLPSLQDALHRGKLHGILNIRACFIGSNTKKRTSSSEARFF